MVVSKDKYLLLSVVCSLILIGFSFFDVFETDDENLKVGIVTDVKKTANGYVNTGDVYVTYTNIANQLYLPILTQRRVADLISELDMLGIINARVKSFGRKGRTKEINVNLSKDVINLLNSDELFQNFSHKSVSQTTFDTDFS